MKRRARVTIVQIARAAGIDKSTVSLALRNDPRLNPKTISRVQKLAAEMGYVPDAHLSQLMGYLRKIDTESAPRNESIAYLTSEPSEAEDLDRRPFFREFHSGARAELERIGYHLESFRLRDYEFRFSRISEVLWNRNIHGIIVSPPVNILTLDEIDWKRFAGITLGYRLQSPRLHRVVSDHLKAMALVLEQIQAAGYKRPLLAYRKGRDRHVGRRWTVSLTGSLRYFPKLETSFAYAGDPGPEFVQFFRQTHADCVVGLNYSFAPALQEAGIRVPEDAGFVSLDTHDGPDHVSGVNQRPDALGRLAARQLAGLLARHEVGVPTEAFTISLEPVWRPGRTL